MIPTPHVLAAKLQNLFTFYHTTIGGTLLAWYSQTLPDHTTLIPSSGKNRVLSHHFFGTHYFSPKCETKSTKIFLAASTPLSGGQLFTGLDQSPHDGQLFFTPQTRDALCSNLNPYV
jgi:hypothetical protein